MKTKTLAARAATLIAMAFAAMGNLKADLSPQQFNEFRYEAECAGFVYQGMISPWGDLCYVFYSSKMGLYGYVPARIVRTVGEAKSALTGSTVTYALMADTPWRDASGIPHSPRTELAR
jgi:hypothetical protein